MPIKAELRHLYGKAWQATRAAILARAGNACECTGQCGDLHYYDEVDSCAVGARCCAPNGQTVYREIHNPAVWWSTQGSWVRSPVRVVLTVAHLNHGDDRPENLAAMCQRCHLRLDRAQYAASAKLTREARRAT